MKIWNISLHKSNRIRLLRTVAILVVAVLLFQCIKLFIKNENDKPQEEEPSVTEETVCEETREEEPFSVLIPGEDIFVPDFQTAARLNTLDLLEKYVYSVDPTAYMKETDVDVEEFISKDFCLNLKEGPPKILIFHTHSQEDFIDSRPDMIEDTIVGVGRVLAEILVEDYQIPVVHDVGKYDYKNGEIVRNGSYQVMEPAVKKLLEKYPSVEILIDLHRDGVADDVRLVTEINGHPTAKIMFFNGITRENSKGSPKELPDLQNPYLKDNLALSLQLFLTTNELYPSFARRIYIRPYRYSLHLKPRSILVEAGANTNTVEEVKNAMVPLAEILVKVLGS